MFFTPHLLHDDRGFPEAWSGSWDFLNSRSSFVSGQQVGECGSLPPLVLLWHGVDLRVLSGVTGHSGSLPSCQKVCEHGALSVRCRLLGHCGRPRFFFIPQHSLKKSEIQFIYDYCLQNIKKIMWGYLPDPGQPCGWDVCPFLKSVPVAWSVPAWRFSGPGPAASAQGGLPWTSGWSTTLSARPGNNAIWVLYEINEDIPHIRATEMIN